MKTILVANDFSKNAEHALEYAMIFANKIHSDIHMIWVDSSVSDELAIDTIDRELRKEIKEYGDSLIKKFQPKLKDGKIKMLFRKGKVYQEITKAARQIEAEMIFAGTHGVSGFEQYWIGSNAYRIVTQAPCPVVTIRREFNFTDKIADILLPIDSSLETKQKLPYTCQVAKYFDATIHLLTLYNSPLSIVRKRINSIALEAEKFIEKSGVGFVHKKLETDNVAATILDYVSENNIKLITIMTDQGTTTANKFLGPYAQQLINNSHVPVMSVRAKEYI